MSETRIDLLVAEDNPRDRDFIQQHLSDRELVFAAGGDEAWNWLGRNQSACLITDIQMPGLNGIELARRLWTLAPEARVLFWTQHGDEMYVRTLERESGGERVYGLVLKDEVPFDAKEAMQRLGRAGIGTRPFFWPMHEQPVFRKRGLFAGESYPVAERLARRGFYLPSGLALTDDQLDEVAEDVARLMKFAG